jgi:hypothetical protein
MSETILDEAKTLVLGDRQAEYGATAAHFASVASAWSTYLEARPGGAEAPISGFDVTMMMALLKIIRLANQKKRDSIVDLAGYAQTASMVD